MKDRDKIQYWDLDNLVMSKPEMEVFIRKVNNGAKMIINVNKHSCMELKYPKLIVGKKYWIDVAENTFSQPQFELCTINYIRSGIVFFTIDSNPEIEHYFEEFCLNHLHTSPEEITVNLDPDYYEVRDFCGKMKVNYIGKVNI
jgi:hypothetical protein